MKFSIKCRVDQAAARDEGRYSFDHVLFDGKQLVATDGRILACYPVEPEEGDEPGLLHTSVLELARRAAPKGEQAQVRVNGSIEVAGRKLERGVDGEFPRYAAVLEDAQRHRGPSVRVGRALLKRLLDALGEADAYLLTLAKGESGPLTIEAERLSGDEREGKYTATGAHGVLMPIVK